MESTKYIDRTKYIGMDVHKETVSIAVMNSTGKLVMESIIETKTATILQFIQGLRGDLHVTFEEGTWAAWLYDLLKPHVTKIVVCDPRRNALLKEGNKGDKVDARKLVELLRAGLVRPVFRFARRPGAIAITSYKPTQGRKIVHDEYQCWGLASSFDSSTSSSKLFI